MICCIAKAITCTTEIRLLCNQTRKNGFPSLNHLVSQLLIHSFVYSFLHPSIHPSIRPSVRPSFRSFIHSSIHLFIHSFIHSFTRLFVDANISPSIYSILTSGFPFNTFTATYYNCKGLCFHLLKMINT